MEIFAHEDKHVPFTENLLIDIPCSIQNNQQAYVCLCINEILHSIGVVQEDDWCTLYAMITDSEIFAEF